MSSSTTRPSIIIERLTPDSPALAHVADWLHGEYVLVRRGKKKLAVAKKV